MPNEMVQHVYLSRIESGSVSDEPGSAWNREPPEGVVVTRDSAFDLDVVRPVPGRCANDGVVCPVAWDHGDSTEAALWSRTSDGR